MAKVARAEQLLERISTRSGLTPSGKDFLIACLDPMHDNQLQNLCGWPDVESAPSIVRCVKQSMVVTRPLSILSGNFDVHLVIYPSLTQIPYANANSAGRYNNFIQCDAATTPHGFNIGGVVAYSLPTGLPLDITQAGGLATAIQVDPAFSQGFGRLIGLGVEVVNTTADLYRSGLVTCYRMPFCFPTASSFTIASGTSGAFGSTSLVPMQHPPPSTREAMLYPGSRQWKAAEGSYHVTSFVGQDNPPKPVTFQNLVLITDQSGTITSGNDDTTNPALNGTRAWTPLAQANAVGAFSHYSFPPNIIHPIHLSGAIYTGLDYNSSLSINVNYYYETFPGVDEPAILVLAKPSAVYDPVALEILSSSMNCMPVAVPASMNPNGEWFSEVVDMISAAAPVVGGLIGGPAGAALGSAAGSTMKGINSYLSAPSSQNAPVNSLAANRAKQAKTMKMAKASSAIANSATKGPSNKKKSKKNAKRK